MPTPYLLDPWISYFKDISIVDTPIASQMSSHSRQITTQQVGQKAWVISFTINTPPISYSTYRQMIAQIRQLNITGSFAFSLVNAPVRLQNFAMAYMGSATSAQLAAATVAASTGSPLNYVNITGLPANTTIFLAGDYVQFGNSVRTVVNNSVSDGFGNLALQVSEILPAYPTVGTGLIYGPNVVWNNCYFSPAGYPEIGLVSDYGKDSIAFKSKQIVLLQSFC